MPPEHRGLRVGSNFQRPNFRLPNLTGPELEMFGEGERVGMRPASEHC
jgi:hypothetical protein